MKYGVIADSLYPIFSMILTGFVPPSPNRILKTIYNFGIRMRRVKIVCTVGPASETSEVLEQLIDHGMRRRPPKYVSWITGMA